MSTYTPDRWVILEFDHPELDQPLRKVFAGWYGGFAGSDSWKLNSGITKVRREGEAWEFEGYSGSVYRCYPNAYGMGGYMHGVYSRWLKEAETRGDTTIRILDIDEIAES